MESESRQNTKEILRRPLRRGRIVVLLAILGAGIAYLALSKFAGNKKSELPRPFRESFGSTVIGIRFAEVPNSQNKSENKIQDNDQVKQPDQSLETKYFITATFEGNWEAGNLGVALACADINVPPGNVLFSAVVSVPGYQPENYPEIIRVDLPATILDDAFAQCPGMLPSGEKVLDDNTSAAAVPLRFSLLWDKKIIREREIIFHR